MTSWPRRVLVAAGATGVLFVVLWQVGVMPAPWQAGLLTSVLIGLVTFLTAWALTEAFDQLVPASWFGARDVPPPPARAGLDHRLGRIRHLLRDTVERDDRPDAVHDLLRELTAERLAARGVDPADPAAVRAAVHPGLYAYLATEPHGTEPVGRRRLSDVVRRIEEL
ncbi:hypothetical protein [Georgenia alba]|uniref:DUF4129 domain-containing protein n=1 Tax=Georgenia alba TaxID=2233858 RepID=A0ABW2Q6T1_9MICO